MRTVHNFIDLRGKRFGRLTVLHRAPNKASGIARWLCRCECGNEHIVRSYHLRNSLIRSCGCLWVESRHKHGLHGTHVYRAAACAKSRCRSGYAEATEYYGRGIRFFPCFNGDVAQAAQWISGNLGWPLPWLKLSLDRINNNGNYEPGNLRWATKREQVSNTRLHSIESFSDAELLAELNRRETIRNLEG